MKKIILLGYMGCGKSTIAKLIAEITNLKALDLDNCIENTTNTSINNLFATKGELYFRKLEHEILSELMNNQDSFVLSLGGGTPCYANNHELLKGENVISIYLNASIPTLYNRLINEKENRPLIADKSEGELKEYIAKNLFDRSYYYNQAQFKVLVDGKSAKEITNEILSILA